MGKPDHIRAATFTCTKCNCRMRIEGIGYQYLTAKAEENGWKFDKTKYAWACTRCAGDFVSLDEFKELMGVK